MKKIMILSLVFAAQCHSIVLHAAPKPKKSATKAVEPSSDKEDLAAILGQDKEAVRLMLGTVNDVITQLQAFMIGIQSNPDMSRMIEKWGRSNAISNWGAEREWNSFKTDVETLLKKLVDTKEQNVKTKEYKYLGFLIANEELSNQIAQLQECLKAHVPEIEIPDFGAAEKMSNEVKKEIQAAANCITQALYENNMNTSLDAIFEAYEPKAQALREVEEQAQQKAGEGSGSSRESYYE